LVEHAHEARIAAFIRHRRPPLVIDSCKPEHIAAFDEFSMLCRDLGRDDAPFNAVSEPAHVEAILQRTMLRPVQSAHILPQSMQREFRRLMTQARETAS
jgi:hypothetical protein